MNTLDKFITITTDSEYETREAGKKFGSLILDTLNSDTLNSISDTLNSDTLNSDTFISDTLNSDTFISDTLNSETFVPNTFVSKQMLSKKIIIALYGGLGVGKTTFVQGFAKGLGVPEHYYITSPTYNIINEYPIDNKISSNTLTLYHIDLYRIGSPDELEYIGFDDIASSDNSVIIIEWPDIVDKTIMKFDITIRIEIDENFNRNITFQKEI